MLSKDSINSDNVGDGKNLIEPPYELEGAKVISWAWSGQKPFGNLPIIDNDLDTDNNSNGLVEIF